LFFPIGKKDRCATLDDDDSILVIVYFVCLRSSSIINVSIISKSIEKLNCLRKLTCHMTI